MTKLIISEELTSILKKQGDKTLEPVVNQLLDMEVDENKKDYINYISVAVDNSAKLSYLTKAKIAALNPPSFWEGEDTRTWDKDYRIMAKPGKVLKQLIPDVSDVILEKFASMYKNESMICGECLNEKDVVIVKGDDIKKYYHMDYYSNINCQENDNNSYLHESCMRHEEAQEYFGIYTKNSCVSMAILFDEYGESISCRCILWAINGKNYYDRIYAVNNEVNRHMQACLEKLGYINISEKNIISPYNYFSLRVQLDYGKDYLDHFPYLDTMYWLNGRTLSNESSSGAVQLQDTDGSYIRNTESCDNCGEEFDEDSDRLHTIRIGSHRHENMCEDCCGWSDYHSAYIADSESVETDYDGLIHCDYVATLHNGKTCHESNAVELYNGEFAHEDEDILEDEDGNRFISGDSQFEEIEGEYYNINSIAYDNIQQRLEEV